jgi:hypothetical protein
LDCDTLVNTECQKAEREGKTPQQFANEILREIKPVRRTDKQLRNAAFTTAYHVALEQWCKVPLTYCERVEAIVITAQVGRDRVAVWLQQLDDVKTKMGASEFCLRLEKNLRGKVEW